MEGSGGREEGEIEDRRYAADAESGEEEVRREEERARRTPAIARCRDAAVGISARDQLRVQESARVGSYVQGVGGGRKSAVARGIGNDAWEALACGDGTRAGCSGGQLIARE